MIGSILVAVAWFGIGFFVGAAWRDRRALRREKDLQSRIEALKLVNQSNRQELASMHQHNGHGQAVQKCLRLAEDYQMKIEAGYPGTADWSFNRGVRHGAQAAVIFLRGWL
jgi:hypothetical protein